MSLLGTGSIHLQGRVSRVNPLPPSPRNDRVLSYPENQPLEMGHSNVKIVFRYLFLKVSALSKEDSTYQAWTLDVRMQKQTCL